MKIKFHYMVPKHKREMNMKYCQAHEIEMIIHGEIGDYLDVDYVFDEERRTEFDALVGNASFSDEEWEKYILR